MKKTLGLISASLLLVSGSMLAIGARERVVAKAPMKAAEAALEMLSSNPEDNASVKFIDRVTIDFGADLAVLDSNLDLDLNIKNAAGESVTTIDWDQTNTFDLDGDGIYNHLVIVYNDAVSEAGEYTLTIPEGTVNNTDLDKTNPETVLHFTVDPSIVRPLTEVELTLNPDGSAELDAKDFTNIKISVSEQGLSTNAKSLTITNPDGTTQEAALNTGVLAYGAASLSGIVAEKSGEYTLTIPEGTFFDDEYASTSGESGKRNLLKEVTYTVKAAEGPVGPIEKAEITSAVLTVDGTTYDLTATPSIEKITDGSTIELGLSSDVPQYIQFSLVDVTPDASGQPLNEYLKRLIDIRKNADGKFVYTFPSQLIELATGHTYSFNFTIYDIENPPYERKELGRASFTATGGSAEYVYSPITLVSVTPDTETEIIDATQIYTLTFSGPVNLVEAESGLNEGQGDTSAFDSFWHNPERTEWNFKAGVSYTYRHCPTVEIIALFKDDNGLTVKGNNGEKDDTRFSYSWDCYLGGGQVNIVPVWEPAIDENGVPTETVDYSQVNELYEFYAWTTDASGIGLGFDGEHRAYLATYNGHKVADVSYEDGDSEKVYKESDRGNPDANSIGVRFRLTKKITAPGKYRLVIPSLAFTLGTQFESKPSCPNEEQYFIEGEATSTGCSIAEGSELSEVSLMAFYVGNDVTIEENTNVRLENEDGNIASIAPVFTISDQGGMISADFSRANNGAPIKLEGGKEYSIVLPKNRVTIAGTDLKYPEFRVNFKGLNTKAETVAFTHSVAGHTSVVSKAVKGETVALTLTPAEGWKVESVSFNGEDVTSEVADNVYTTPVLDADANVDVKLAYDGAVVEPSGMDDIVTDFNVRVWSENGSVVIAGLENGTNVNVFTADGANVTSFVAADPQYSIALAPAAYIITLSDGQKTAAVKVLNK